MSSELVVLVHLFFLFLKSRLCFLILVAFPLPWAAACSLRQPAIRTRWFRCLMTMQSQRRGTKRAQSNLGVQQADPSPGPGAHRSKNLWLFKSEFGGRASASIDTPQIDGQSSAHRHNGFFLLCTARPAVEQYRLPTFQRRIVRLKAHAAPGQFDQSGAYPPVAVFGNWSTAASATAGVHTGTHAGQAGDLPPVFEPIPIQDLSLQYLTGQGADTTGLRMGCVL